MNSIRLSAQQLTKLCSIALCLLIAACSSVTIKPNGGQKIIAPPSYEERKTYYLAGLIGEHTVDVNEVCEGGNVVQMQTITTGNDWVLSVVTLFIYSPRTARVWCEA